MTDVALKPFANRQMFLELGDVECFSAMGTSTVRANVFHTLPNFPVAFVTMAYEVAVLEVLLHVRYWNRVRRYTSVVIVLSLSFLTSSLALNYLSLLGIITPFSSLRRIRSSNSYSICVRVILALTRVHVQGLSGVAKASLRLALGTSL